MASIYIETFGCQMNEADSQYVADRATSAGYAIADTPEAANVLLLNTCTVRDNAERRAYGRMTHFKLLKDADPRVRLVVMGCLAEQDRETMRARVPHLDAVFGTKELVQLGDQLAEWHPDFNDSVEFSDERALIVPLGGTADAVAGPYSHLRAFVNVQRGCSYYCTFCIVPHVRGRFDHRSSASILADVRERIAGGAREIMLVGQTVNAWSDAGSGADFGDLCRAVAQLPGLERLTFISPHPKDFSPKIVADLGAIAALNPRIHLPLQSFSDRVLRRMNRKYTSVQFDDTVALLRRNVLGCAITTDIIVGFPGETEEDFAATLAYVRSGAFANAYTFLYSVRRGTPAARWEQVPNDVAKERFGRLIEAQNNVTRSYHDRKIGAIARVLLAGESKKDAAKLSAKSPDNVTVVAEKPADYEEALYAREPWVDVEISAAHVWGCSGTIVRRSSSYAGAGVTVRRAALSLL